MLDLSYRGVFQQFDKDLLCNYYVPDPVLGTGDIVINKTE